jgi:hypothetical protein
MCRLIIGTPSSYCISNVSTPELDLSVIAHNVEKILQERVTSARRIGCGAEKGVSGAGRTFLFLRERFRSRTTLYWSKNIKIKMLMLES